MQQCGLADFAVDQRLVGLPAWLLKREPRIAEHKKAVQLSWYCTCKLNALSKVEHYHGKAKPNDEEVAKTWALKVAELHPQCGPRSKGEQEDDPVAEALRRATGCAVQAASANRGLKRQLTELENKSALLLREVNKAQGAVASQIDSERRAAHDKARRKRIDPDCNELLSPADVSYAKNAPKTGLLDVVKYWARGSSAAVLQLVWALVLHFQLEEQLRERLTDERASTNQYIVGRIGDALSIAKRCASEQQRREYRVILTAVAPELAAQRDKSGMSRKVAAALGVYRKGAPFRDAVAKRDEIDKLDVQYDKPLKIGDQVRCRHGTGKLTAMPAGLGGKCTVQVEVDGRVFDSKFDSMGSGKGGGRVHRPAIEFGPESRKKRKDAVPEAVKNKTAEHCSIECPTSPCMKDRVRKRVGTGMYIVLNCMILYCTVASLFGSFQAYCPELFAAGLALSYKQYCKELPWNLRRVARESCLCKSCENFGLYEAALEDILIILAEALGPQLGEDEEVLEGTEDPIFHDPDLVKLMEMSEMDRRIDKVKHLLCSKAFECQKMDCLNSACDKCGFRACWSNGLRGKLVTEDGQLKPGEHPIWLKTVTWSRYKTAKGVGTVVNGDPQTKKEMMKQQLSGTITEFLDDHERAWRKYPYHRYTLERTRQSNLEFVRNCRPGTLKMDVDHVEDYTVEDARSVQSEYGLQVQVSLFMNVASLLLQSAWHAARGKLTARSEVTVQLTAAQGYSRYGFWASVVTANGGSSPTSIYTFYRRRAPKRARAGPTQRWS